MKGQEIEGLDELIKAFSELGDGHILKLRDATIEAATIVKDRAKTKINSKSGDLASSLKVTKPSKKSKSEFKIVAKVGFSKKAMHGVPLELGHRLYFMGHKTNSDVAPHPFLRPAADECKDETASLIADAMNKALKEWGDGG